MYAWKMQMTLKRALEVQRVQGYDVECITNKEIHLYVILTGPLARGRFTEPNKYRLFNVEQVP